MTTALNPRYQPPFRDELSFIPAWYSVETSNVIKKLAQVDEVAITCDGWTSVAQDHFLMVTVHYIYQGKMEMNMLSTEVVYDSQTGPVVVKEIASVVDQFHLREKIIAATVDNPSNMDVALRNLDFFKSRMLCSHAQPSSKKGSQHSCSFQLVCQNPCSCVVAEALIPEQNYAQREAANPQ